MVLSVGLISAVILNKKRPGYRTKLQKLTDKLERSPLTHLTLHQIPLQKIITIFCIFLFILFIALISQQAAVEISSIYHNASNQRQALNLSFSQYGSEICKFPHKQTNFPRRKNQSDRLSFIEQNILRQSENETSFSSKTVWCAIAGYGLAILALISQLKVKRSHFERKNDSIITITFTELSIFPPSKNSVTHSIATSSYKQVSIKIYKKGQEKFTNSNSVFCVVLNLLTPSKQCTQLELIRRASIFDARKATIQICSVFSIKPDWQIYSNSKIETSSH